MKKIMVMISLCGAFTIGCSTVVPITTTMNDTLSMLTKTNSKETVCISVASSVKDGVYVQKDTADSKTKDLVFSDNSQAVGYQMTPGVAFKAMSTEYLNNKFSKIAEKSNTSVSITLSKFDASSALVNSTGAAMAAAMFGGEVQSVLRAKVTVDVSITKGGKTVEKKIVASSEATHTSGYSTGTETSNVYRGENNYESVMGRNINSAMNKALASVNAFLEENQL